MSTPVDRVRMLLGRLRGGPGVARNTVFMSLSSIIRLALGLLILPLLVDHIGKPQTGLLTFAATLTGYFTAVDLSVASSVTRYVAEHRAREDHDMVATTVRSSLLVLIGFGVLLALVLAIMALTLAKAIFPGPQVRNVAEPTMLVAAATTAVYWPSRIGISTLSGLERYDQFAQITLSTFLLLLLGLFIGVHAGFPVALLTGLYGIGSCADGLIGIALSWRPLGVSRRWARGNWLRGDQLRTVFSFGAAAFVIGIADTLLYAFDRTIVGAVVGASAIVYYNAGQSPMNGVRVIAQLAGGALVSPVARLWTEGRKDLVGVLVRTSTLVGILLTIPLAVMVMVLAAPFLRAWLGGSVGPGVGHYAPYIDVFVAYWLLNSIAMGISPALYGIGRLEMYSRVTIVGALVSLPLSVGLTYAWGTIGVIWGTTIPGLCMIPVFVYYGLRLLEIPVVAFIRAVVIPGLSLIPWSAAVVAVDLAVDPSGWLGMAAFAAVGLTVYWGALAPKLRREIAAARASAATAPA